MKRNIENEKRHFTLGVTGSKVDCMLFDDIDTIKHKNNHLSADEVNRVYRLLQKQIEEIENETKEREEYEKRINTTED